MSENSKTCAPRIMKISQAIALAAILLLSAGAARAQEATAGTEGHDTMHLLVGRSLVINSPTRIRRLSIADPNIADALLINPTQILVNGKAPGGVSLVLWNESDQSQLFELFVDMDILGLSEKIHEEFPDEKVKVEASKDLVMVSGHASTKAIADKIMQVVTAVNPKVVNLMDSPGKPIDRGSSARGEICRSGSSRVEPVGNEPVQHRRRDGSWKYSRFHHHGTIRARAIDRRVATTHAN